MSSLRLIGDFGPPAVRSYVSTRRKTRWWPALAAFGAGAACIVLMYGLPAHRPELQTALHVYAMPKGPQPDYAAPVALQAQPTPPEPAKTPEERALASTDHATGLPALELISGPEVAQSSEPTRHAAAKRHRAAASRHVATKSKRHERYNAYARYYAPGRYGYSGSYSSY
jgi:hypothetical protein